MERNVVSVQESVVNRSAFPASSTVVALTRIMSRSKAIVTTSMCSHMLFPLRNNPSLEGGALMKTMTSLEQTMQGKPEFELLVW